MFNVYTEPYKLGTKLQSLKAELRICKMEKLGTCIRPYFANPITTKVSFNCILLILNIKLCSQTVWLYKDAVYIISM